jgi:mRNA interferase YafQ
MNSKKTADSKRTKPPLAVDYSKAFLKDWEDLSRSGRYDMKRLKSVMMALVSNDATLGAEWKDHPLAGDLSGFRECHIGGDFLLIYKKDDEAVVFSRAGSHAGLFE